MHSFRAGYKRRNHWEREGASSAGCDSPREIGKSVCFMPHVRVILAAGDAQRELHIIACGVGIRVEERDIDEGAHFQVEWGAGG